MKPNNFERMVDLRVLKITEEELAAYEYPEIVWESEDEHVAKTILRLMRDPDRFHFTCSRLFGVKLSILQCVLIKEMWKYPFPMLVGSRGIGKTWMLAMYAILFAIFRPGSKVVIVGAGFRQAKAVIKYAASFCEHSPILKSMFPGDQYGFSRGNEKWVLTLGRSTITALPMGDGETIRGERANLVIGDEFAAQNDVVFETVVAGFGVVQQDPDEQIRREAEVGLLKEMGLWTPSMEEAERAAGLGNQLIISGTSSYQFNHFYKYWRRYKGIIESRGDRKALEKAHDGKCPEDIDWRDYAIFRIPYTFAQTGYYSKKMVTRAEGSNHSSIFLMEYEACFPADSDGYFKRTAIEFCTTYDPLLPAGGGEPVVVQTLKKGREGCRYLFGVDPASEKDRFSIVVLEVHPTWRAVVHGWSTTRQEIKAKNRGTEFDTRDFYKSIARKIRDLMKLFPCDLISMDKMGGGVAVLEALGDKDNLQPGEEPIYLVEEGHPLYNPNFKGEEQEGKSGLHIVEFVYFANQEFTHGSNTGLRKDLEDRALLFPPFDQERIAVEGIRDDMSDRKFDTYEDVCFEIHDLKDELTTIKYSQTPGTMRDKWDTPEEKLAGSKKGRMRKDRYSALLMANYAARRMCREEEPREVVAFGGAVVPGSGFFDDDYGDDGPGPDNLNPDWWERDVMSNLDLFGVV